jgi:signal transduction histidine kinase
VGAAEGRIDSTARPEQPRGCPLAGGPRNANKNGPKPMRQVIKLAVVTATVGIATAAAAADYGTPEEARAMLERAVAAVEEDKAAALAMFAKGEGGFKDRDLYPYCGGPDGLFTAHPTLVGKSLKDQKDKAGMALGTEVYGKAKEGEMAEVAYMWPRPGETEPVQKVVYVTKVADQVCAVGYYK